MTEGKKPKTVQRFKVIPGGKVEEVPEPPSEPIEGTKPNKVPDIAGMMANLDPERVKEFDQVIKGLFKSLQANEEPKMFQCGHCGGFHSLDINCSVCKSVNKAQQVFTMDRLDRMFALAMCHKCLAVSVAIFQCRGIDPQLFEIQKEYAENMKTQQGALSESKPEQKGKK